MKVSDFVVSYLKGKYNIVEYFGYPGASVCHLMDSILLDKEIRTHLPYHEQAASFSACAYAQATGKIAAVYVTRGPGVTNIISGITNAWLDSVPVLFLTGQIDTYDMMDNSGQGPIRTKGFQEVNTVGIVKKITKYAVCVTNKNDIKYALDKAVYEATNGRKGPAVIDIPADVQRAEIDLDYLKEFFVNHETKSAMVEQERIKYVEKLLKAAKKPVFIVGAGCRYLDRDELISFFEKIKVPVVTTSAMVDFSPGDFMLNMGVIGRRGNRNSNFILKNSDLVISLGARLDSTEIIGKRNEFVSKANLVRIDIDEKELEYRVRRDETQICMDVKDFLKYISNAEAANYSEWLYSCLTIKRLQSSYEHDAEHLMINAFSKLVPDDYNITLDAGQNKYWCIQSFELKKNQRVFMSVNLATMGYALPAAIGAFWGNHKPTIVINGDGGFQMNMQELQAVARDHLPFKICIMNNSSLGLVRQFQEVNFERRYSQVNKESGYTNPDFKKIASAYGLGYHKITTLADLGEIEFNYEPEIIEFAMSDITFSHIVGDEIEETDMDLSHDEMEDLKRAFYFCTH